MPDPELPDPPDISTPVRPSAHSPASVVPPRSSRHVSFAPSLVTLIIPPRDGSVAFVKPQIHQLHRSVPNTRLIKLNGTIAGHSAIVLVDCGATGQFVSSSFVSRHELPLAKVGSNSRITLADGRSSEADGVLSSVPVTLSSYTESLDFTVTTLRGYDAILGMEWLRRYNPAIDWRDSSVSFVDSEGNRHTLSRSLSPLEHGAPPVNSSSFVVVVVVTPVESRHIETVGEATSSWSTCICMCSLPTDGLRDIV